MLQMLRGGVKGVHTIRLTDCNDALSEAVLWKHSVAVTKILTSKIFDSCIDSVPAGRKSPYYLLLCECPSLLYT